MTTPENTITGAGDYAAQLSEALRDVFAEPETIPCDCGSDKANWRGDRYGLRMYLCPDCASHYPELLAAE